MTQAHDAEIQQMTVMVITEPSTPTFQLGETLADTIEETKKQNPMIDDFVIVTNNVYLNGWARKHGYSTTLVNDEEILESVANDSVPIIMMVPSAETMAHKNGEIALVPNDESILIAVQNELLRLDDEGKSVHTGTLITMMLPPEYLMVRAENDPDTYIRVVATPKLPD